MPFKRTDYEPPKRITIQHPSYDGADDGDVAFLFHGATFDLAVDHQDIYVPPVDIEVHVGRGTPEQQRRWCAEAFLARLERTI